MAIMDLPGEGGHQGHRRACGSPYSEGCVPRDPALRDCGDSCWALTAFSLLIQNLKSVGTSLCTMTASHSGLGRDCVRILGSRIPVFRRFSGEGLSHA